VTAGGETDRVVEALERARNVMGDDAVERGLIAMRQRRLLAFAGDGWVDARRRQRRYLSAPLPDEWKGETS
jgi:hypothetical protein